MIQIENELAVFLLGFLLRELSFEPGLAFILAQVLHHKRLDPLDSKQAFAGGMDGKAPQVAGNPTAVKFFSNGGGSA